MLVRLFSAAVNGLDVRTVEVEVNISKGMGYSLVGLPDSAVRESYTRTQTAIANSGFHFATNSIVVNLAPADLRKEGSGYDLPIALGILAAEGAVNKERLSKYMLVGELGLDGSLRPVRGALPIAIHARAEEYEGLIVPVENVREAAAVNKLMYTAQKILHKSWTISTGAANSRKPLSTRARSFTTIRRPISWTSPRYVVRKTSRERLK